MTTAITRPDLHINSIGKFYNDFYLRYKEQIDKEYQIFHIINIDHPEKLKKHFTVEETINNFNLIIPEHIKKIYIETTEPSFLNAYKNIMTYISQDPVLNSSNELNLYWWFEDDWRNTIDINFFNIIYFLKEFKICAMTFTFNSQLGSFRGGPVMNNEFFYNYFDINSMGYANSTCDPEKQIVRYIGAKTHIILSEEKKIIRDLTNDDDKRIKLILMYIDETYDKITLDFGTRFYTKKFDENIKFEYHIILINNYNFDTFEHVQFIYGCSINLKSKDAYNTISINEFKNIINDDSINYFIVKPYCFEDCGRDYATKYNLIKGWNKIGDPITYS